MALPRLFADRVLRVSFVFTDVFHQLGIGLKFELQRKRPGLGIGLGAVNRDFGVHMTEVAPAEAFDGVQSFGMRTAAVIDPAPVIETASIYHEPVAFPLADGKAEPGGIAHPRMRTAVCEDLTV